jgi:hypothetical protein
MATIKQSTVQKKRSDPRARPIDPMEAMSRIQDADPDLRYIWAPLHGMLDVNYYESLGYTKVYREEGGARPVRISSNIKNGEVIVQFEAVLMSIPKDQHREEIYEPGQNDMTVLEKKIYDKEFARREISRVDGMRGMIGEELIDAVNQTSPLTPGI